MYNDPHVDRKIVSLYGDMCHDVMAWFSDEDVLKVIVILEEGDRPQVLSWYNIPKRLEH